MLEKKNEERKKKKLSFQHCPMTSKREPFSSESRLSLSFFFLLFSSFCTKLTAKVQSVCVVALGVTFGEILCFIAACAIAVGWKMTVTGH